MEHKDTPFDSDVDQTESDNSASSEHLLDETAPLHSTEEQNHTCADSTPLSAESSPSVTSTASDAVDLTESAQQEEPGIDLDRYEDGKPRPANLRVRAVHDA